MDAVSETNPTLAKLTPLANVLALIDGDVEPVAPRNVEAGEALQRVLAADVVVAALPRQALALIDGWALAAQTTLDAGGYAPAPLPSAPVRIEAGQPMPAGCDCVAPFDAVKVSGDRAEALAVVNPGDGVLPPGGDSDGKLPLRRAGDKLRAIDLAVLAAAGISELSVCAPRVHVLALRDDAIIASAARLIAVDAARRGGEILQGNVDMNAALAEGGTDLVVIVGGTGSGRNDNSVARLSRAGRLAVHGIGLTPGESAAFGFAGTRPVLLLPGRLDAAVAVWLTLGRRLLHRLAGGRTFDDPAETLTLARKLVSTVGLAELIPVRRSGDAVEPLASKYLPFSALGRADGWVLVPPESEGYSAGARVSVRPWP